MSPKQALEGLSILGRAARLRTAAPVNKARALAAAASRNMSGGPQDDGKVNPIGDDTLLDKKAKMLRAEAVAEADRFRVVKPSYSDILDSVLPPKAGRQDSAQKDIQSTMTAKAIEAIHDNPSDPFLDKSLTQKPGILKTVLMSIIGLNPEVKTNGNGRIKKRILIIGYGNMLQPMVSSLYKAHGDDIEVIICSPNGRGTKIIPDGVEYFTSPDQLANDSFDVLMIGMKPQQFESSIVDYKGKLRKEDGTVISILAGISVKQIAKHFPDNTYIARAMPNLASKAEKGAAAVLHYMPETEDQVSFVVKFLESSGIVLPVFTEDAINKVTAISGSGPAYIFYAIQVYAEAAKDVDFDCNIAKCKKFFGDKMQAAHDIIKKGLEDGKSMDAIEKTMYADVENKEGIKGLFLNEKGSIRNILTKVIELTGSTPQNSYCQFLIIKSFIDAAKDLKLDGKTSEKLALQTVLGSIVLAFGSEKTVNTLREEVTSKGGTTEAALKVLMGQDESYSIRDRFKLSVKSAYDRAVELSKPAEAVGEKKIPAAEAPQASPVVLDSNPVDGSKKDQHQK